MKSLMEVCRNWGANGCHPNISKWKSIARIEEGREILIPPEREELNKICWNCIALSFKECLNCNSKNFFVKSDVENNEKGKKIENLSFYCDNCKATFIITRTI